VNRLSLGIQSLRDDELRFLGRVHTADEARRTAGDARDAGFENLSLDLIYCLPGQTPATWKETLDAALALQPDHFSAYCLQIEEDTPFAARVAGGEFEPLDDDRQAEMYLRTAQILSEAGYQHYEVSNFALPGRRCVHNLTYWHNEPYLGIGAAAWSYLNGERRGNVRDVDAYLEAWRTRQSAVAYRERCGPVQAANETLMMALRLAEGIDLAAFAGRHGVDLATHRADDIGSLSEAGLIGLRGSRLALTTRGLAVATEITALLALSEEEGSP
jgi:oxygen-independent coproporphyrinogen-3 oxidase